MLVSVGREEKSWKLSPVWSKISHSQNQTHGIELQETLLISTSQSIAYLLVAKIPTHLVSQVFAENEIRAEEKQNKFVPVTGSGMLPVCPALLKVCFLFFLQDFCERPPVAVLNIGSNSQILTNPPLPYLHFYFLCTPPPWALAFSEEQGKVLLSMAKETANKLMQHDPRAAVLHQFL